MALKKYLRNSHYVGGIWVDARVAEKNKPFCELQPVPGFPRKVEYATLLEFEMTAGNDVLFRKETNVDRATEEPIYWALTYRISADSLEEIVFLPDCEL